MSAKPPFLLLERVPAGAWTALAWCVGLAFTLLTRVRLPGEVEAAVTRGVLLTSAKWEGWTALAVATAVTLAGSRLLHRRPLAALTLLLAGAVIAPIALSVGEIPLAQFLAVDVALYVIAAGRSHRTGIVATAMALAVLAGYLTARLVAGWHVGMSAELAVALTAVIAWLLGNSAHQARAHEEQSRVQIAAQAATAERLRIARELHDMVAHNIGIIALQAGAASRVIDSQPAAARDALSAIETAGRETLAGLRRMLGVLRQPGPGQEPQAAPLEPDTGLGAGLDSGLGLADVDRLVSTTAAVGVDVDVRWRGDRRTLPPEIDMSAYRIIQEAVTNVIRHAGTRSCQVVIDHRDEELAIEILDGGRGLGDTMGIGYGLLGMRERVGLLHGEFAAGPRPEGGFRVAARLPVPAGVR
ncbi:MAG: sensor histidine kinase [Actinomadura sp.]